MIELHRASNPNEYALSKQMIPKTPQPVAIKFINYLQDKSTVLLPWFYSWPTDVPSVKGTLHGASFKASGTKGHAHPAFDFAGEWPLGFKTVGCPFVDDNMTQFWANELGNNTQLGIGLMDTE